MLAGNGTRGFKIPSLTSTAVVAAHPSLALAPPETSSCSDDLIDHGVVVYGQSASSGFDNVRVVT
jgi:hypothetical protein